LTSAYPETAMDNTNRRSSLKKHGDRGVVSEKKSIPVIRKDRVWKPSPCPFVSPASHAAGV